MSFFSFDDDSLQKHEKKSETNEKPFSRPSRVYKVYYVL